MEKEREQEAGGIVNTSCLRVVLLKEKQKIGECLGRVHVIKTVILKTRKII